MRLDSPRRLFDPVGVSGPPFGAPPSWSPMSQVVLLSPGKREQTKAVNRLAILDAAREVFG